MPSRPIHVTLDRSGAFALVAYNNPSSVTVHRINADGTIGEEVKQAAVLDGGIFAHQIRTTPANDAAILVTRGNDAAAGKAEDPGALKVFSFKDGQLANRASIAPNGGFGFGPRHLDFHPTLPLCMCRANARTSSTSIGWQTARSIRNRIFVKERWRNPATSARARRRAPSMCIRTAAMFYVSNRAFDTVNFDGKKIFPGGENNIAVFAIDPATGEPTLIQNEDVRGIYPRTFALDPAGACWS